MIRNFKNPKRTSNKGRATVKKIFKLLSIGKVTAFIFLVTSIALPNSIFATTVGLVNESKNIETINVTVKQGDKYTLPKLIMIKDDKSTRNIPVTWNPSNVDTSKIGTFTFKGTVQGSDKKIYLILIVQKYIKSIEDMSATVYQGDNFTLPSTVTAVMSDNTTQQVAVTWNPSEVDTSEVGIFTFYGTVQGYDKNFILTLNIQERGNTNGNILNFGLVAQKDNCIYYIKNTPNNETTPPTINTLYKSNIDGTGKTKLIINCQYINVVGDWIYYANEEDDWTIYKIKTDGTESAKLNTDRSYRINVVGDWIYFMNSYDDGKIYRIRTDGTGKTKLSDDPLSGDFINVVGDWIYYSASVGGYYGSIYKMKTDGTEKTLVIPGEGASELNVVGDWIYYLGENEELYKIKTNGTEKTKLNDDHSNWINVVGNWVYYSNSNDSGKLYKIKIDGTEKTKLNDDYSLSINVAGDWIYYMNAKNELYKIKTDGTEMQIVN